MVGLDRIKLSFRLGPKELAKNLILPKANIGKIQKLIQERVEYVGYSSIATGYRLLRKVILACNGKAPRVYLHTQTIKACASLAELCRFRILSVISVLR